MKAITILKRSLLSIAIVPALLFAGGGKALAAQIPYVPGQPLPTTSTPAFNVFSNIPYGVGDESDFVRIRPSDGTSNDSGTNGIRNTLYTDTITAACNVGEMYDVRTYVHNGADPTFNNADGSGTAVAHGVQVAMTANIGTDGTTFPFTSTITANNATSVTDKATLNCNSSVRLEVVPSSIKAYSKTLGWQDVTIDAVNGKIKIGSRDMNSGDVWGCWDERVQIVYTVKVVAVPTPPTPIYSCDLLTNTGKISDNKYGFKVDVTAKNGAVLKDITYAYSDKTTNNDSLTTTHTFTDAATSKRTVTATANFTVTGMTGTQSVTSAKCATEITATTVTPTPTVLPNTGAGNTIAIFLGTSFIGAFLYRMRALRSLR
jgi:LPXTG-motif cell wall-anchored protein